MTTFTYQKTVHASYLVVIAGIITMPDVIFGLVAELMHLLFELAHLLFEFLESTLDHLVEHVFHTEVHETQVIVFYLIVSMGAAALYYLFRSIPGAYHNVKNNIIETWLEYKRSALRYWTEQSLINKFKWIVIVNTGLVCLFLFGF
ncbi:MAG: hypothetical protein HOP23_01025 [Methylococcaceae bacterium]|nr:hypothetical protein [Methylococcaceae bacterium]